MKFKRSIIKYSFAAVGLLMLLAFQNCSKIQATSIPLNSASSVNGAGVTPGTDTPMPSPSSPNPSSSSSSPASPSSPSCSVEEAVSACLESTKANVVLESVMSGLRGKAIIDVSSMASLSDFRGSTTLRGIDKQAHINTISDVGGSLIICGLAVDTIENTNGKVVLVNSKVKSLADHKGSVFLYESTIDSVSGVTGQVKALK